MVIENTYALRGRPATRFGYDSLFRRERGGVGRHRESRIAKYGIGIDLVEKQSRLFRVRAGGPTSAFSFAQTGSDLNSLVDKRENNINIIGLDNVMKIGHKHGIAPPAPYYNTCLDSYGNLAIKLVAEQ